MSTTAIRSEVTPSRTDLVTMLLATWLMIGLFLDGYAHTNIIEELESFFTPWHAVFYSGFLATAGWIGWTAYRRMAPGGTLRDAVPPGYGLSVVGVVLFGVGGVGDGIWHTLFGIETGIDALLSPTHLLLFLGAFLMLTTPIRTARLRSPGLELAVGDRAVVIMSLTLTSALVGFIFVYLWASGQPWIAERPFDPRTGLGQFEAEYGIAAILVTNLLLLAPIAYTMKLWRAPLGLMTSVWVVVNLMVALAFDQAVVFSLIVGLGGGISGDLLMRLLRAGPDRPIAVAASLAAPPAIAWGAWFIAIAVINVLRWPPEIWGGVIVFASLTGLALSALVLPGRWRRPTSSG